jgi:apolipoprotein N-acyltransferase
MIIFLTTLYSFLLVGLLGYATYRSLKLSTLWLLIKNWLVYGLISNFIIFAVYYTAIPFENLSIPLSFVIISIIVLVLSFTLALPYALIGCAAWVTKDSLLKRFVSVIFAFTLVEIARSYLFILVTWGGGSVFGAYISTWSIGSILASTPLLIFASMGGVFTLSFVIMCLISLTVYPMRSQIRVIGFMAVLLAWAGIRFFLFHPPNLEPITFGIVQTAFNSPIETENTNNSLYYAYQRRAQDVIHPLVMSFRDTAPDLIILPEDSRYVDLQSVKQRQEINESFPDSLILDNATRSTSDGIKNISIAYDPKTGTAFMRNKRFLFPFGEYIPFFMKSIISLFVNPEKLALYESQREYTSGEAPYAYDTKFGRVGVLICSELTSSNAIASLKKSRPDVVVLQSSLLWTHDNPYYLMSHILALKILAVSVARPVISVSNGGPSIMLDAYGRINSFKENAFGTYEYLLKGTTITPLEAQP